MITVANEGKLYKDVNICLLHFSLLRVNYLNIINKSFKIITLLLMCKLFILLTQF